MTIAKSTTIKISPQSLKKGVVLMDLGEYQNLKMHSVPTYYLKGKKALALDKEVEQALKEHKEGKTIRLNSLRDLR